MVYETKIGLLIVGKKGVETLRGLIKLGLTRHIVFVLSYDDANISDKSYLCIHNICERESIQLFSGRRLPSGIINNVDKVIMIGWQYLVHESLEKMIVLHDSYLPEYKGWAPTVNYLINGSRYLGATALQPTIKMDTGPIIKQLKRDISYPLKIDEALSVIAELYVELCEVIIEGDYKLQSMSDEGESFCLWRTDEDYYIDWSDDSGSIMRFIDAVGYPYAGAKFKYEGAHFIVSEAVNMPDTKIVNPERHLGKILMYEGEDPVVVCGEGTIKLTKIKSVEQGLVVKFDKVKMRFK